MPPNPGGPKKNRRVSKGETLMRYPLGPERSRVAHILTDNVGM
jgi:hypothetical protein